MTDDEEEVPEDDNEEFDPVGETITAQMAMEEPTVVPGAEGEEADDSDEEPAELAMAEESNMEPVEEDPVAGGEAPAEEDPAEVLMNEAVQMAEATQDDVEEPEAVVDAPEELEA